MKKNSFFFIKKRLKSLMREKIVWISHLICNSLIFNNKLFPMLNFHLSWKVIELLILIMLCCNCNENIITFGRTFAFSCLWIARVNLLQFFSFLKYKTPKNENINGKKKLYCQQKGYKIVKLIFFCLQCVL